MESSGASVNTFSIWNSEESEFFLNPKWPTSDQQKLLKLVETYPQQKATIWLATSGSSAENFSAVKMVALTKKAILNAANAANRHLHSDSTDRWLQVLPRFHIGGLAIEARAFLSGAEVVQQASDFQWNAQNFLQLLNQHQITLCSLVPTQVYDLVQAHVSANSSIRAILVGGGALDEKLYLQARDLGWPLLPSFGMTECCSQVATASLQSLSQNVFPKYELLDHIQARTDQNGILQIKSDSLLTGYTQYDSQGLPHWTIPFLADAWFVTEDKASLDGRFLTIYGRDRDFIKIGGESVSVVRLRAQLSEALNELKLSDQKTVLLNVSDERLGQKIILVTEESSEETRFNISSLYSQKVLPFEKSRETFFLPTLPRSDLGKILYAQIKKQLGVF